jgi:hypothetical protein
MDSFIIYHKSDIAGKFGFPAEMYTSCLYRKPLCLCFVYIADVILVPER